ncbi:MAG: UDP-3-O-(3-hydroxymyristoyl)glucosamine N-acyltransferase [Rhodobacteraceae bacterium]|nr:UDP-3-O-(3-hydroxymyristoyl)glucosamine N-acyltransferase [Paracoccaceae bacterium]
MKMSDIAAALGATAQGADLEITRLSEPASAGPDDLALASNPKYAEALGQGQARAALLWGDADWQALGLEAAICVGRPRYAMSSVTALYDAQWRAGLGVHPTALIPAGFDGAVGAYSVIAENAQIGPDAVIGSHVSIGPGVIIGDGATIKDGVRISHGVTIGARVVIQPGAVIGGDGFSFVTPEPSAAEAARSTLGEAGGEAQAWARIHSVGGVEIGDDVEVGANSSIDRGTIRATRVGSGTKIDSLVQVGHNAEIGEHCLLCAQAGVAGSSVIGNHCVLGGQSGVSDNLSVGDRVVLGGASVVMANVPAGRVMLGYPATQMKQQIESYKALRRLPRDLASLKKAVSKLSGSD